MWVCLQKSIEEHVYIADFSRYATFSPTLAEKQQTSKANVQFSAPTWSWRKSTTFASTDWQIPSLKHHAAKAQWDSTNNSHHLAIIGNYEDGYIRPR
jgi:hypothetical protein